MIFDRLLDNKDETTRIEQKQQKRVEYHLVKQERRIRGLTLFSYNTITHEIKAAEIIHCKDVDFVTRKPVHQPKLMIEPNCVYRQALNKKNFVRKLKMEGIMQ